MTLFEHLRAETADDWDAYTRHDFVEQLGEGTLPLPAFQDYLVQDYLFLIQFARAYALAAYKARSLDDIRQASYALSGVLTETSLHARLTASWGISPAELEATEERMGTVAYTRFVLDCGASGDLLDLHVALAPCAIGYAEIGTRLAPRLEGRPEHAYGDWIAEYAGEDFQASARAAIARLDELAGIGPAGIGSAAAGPAPAGPTYAQVGAGDRTSAGALATAANPVEALTDRRLAELTRIFRTATRLEAAFWQQALDAV